MSWGGLNNALTAWRNAVMRRFPDKDTASDGARADAAHVAGGTSQHIPDSDGTVDAYDCDDDLRHPGAPAGSAAEKRLQEAMKLDFEQDPHDRAQLWIHNREIANRDVSDWHERDYDGQNPHDKHFHFQSRQSREDDGREWPMPHTDALLREMRGDDVNEADIEAVANRVMVKLTAALETAATGDQGDDHAIVRNLRRIPWGYPGMLERMARLDAFLAGQGGQQS